MNVERMYKEQRDDALAQVDRLARALAKQDPWLMTGPCVGCGLTGFEGGASQNTPICGRVGFLGRAHNGFGLCAHCTNGTRRPENAGPPAAHL